MAIAKANRKPDFTKEYLMTWEAALLLNYSENHFHKHIKTRPDFTPTCRKISRKQHIWSKQELLDWVESLAS